MDLRQELQRILAEKKRALVVGLGISGIETVKFLVRAGIEAVAVERTEEEKFTRTSKFKDAVRTLREAGAQLHFGVDGEKAAQHFDGVALAVLSPGVSLESAICGSLKHRSIPYVSELELGLQLFNLPSIIVTGSNGKTTTVTLIHELLKAAGFDSFLCGNVGVPVVAELSREHIFADSSNPKRILVVEASSYQLETCSTIKPKVALLLNLSDNHLERHGTLQRYFEAKARLFANQDKNDFAVLNGDDAMVSALQARVRSQVVFFGSKQPVGGIRNSARIEGQSTIALQIDGKPEAYDVSSAKLLGIHNRYNMAAALLAVRLVGAERTAVAKAVVDFLPLEHRLEFLEVTGRPLYINDSKSTTVAAAVAALRSVVERFPQRRVSLMLGGLAKAGSWDPLMLLMSENQGRLKRSVCFGKDGNLLASHCRRHSLPYVQAKNLEEAVHLASEQSSPEDVVLLSPGCASFDQFSDFEERGNVFKSLVRSIK
jgi:UDP-N-acetylmuramoylalanine--D-glutamate ligase